MKTGIANLPLHYGKAPRWFFSRSIEFLRKVLSLSKIGNTEKLEAIKRLNAL